MNTKQVKLGLCPIGKFVFSHEDACRQKTKIQKSLREWGVSFVDLEGVLPDGMVRDQNHVESAVAFFKKENVDAVFLPHCNFGTEGAAGMIGKKLGLPVLLWGPRDEAPLPDGTRLRDTLCGMFASSKVLHKLGVPFTYIENCRMEEPAFRQVVDTFLRAVNVANVFRKGTRIGLVGQRIDFFWTTICNESELLEKFNIQILPIDMVEFIRYAKSRVSENRSAYQKKVRDFRNEWIVESFDNDEPLMNIFAVHDQLQSLAKDQNLEGFAIQDFMSLIDEMGTYCFLANSLISEDYAVGCESDIHGAISDILIRRATFNTQPGFLADITVRHPKNNNGVLLWHAGAPLSMRDPAVKPHLGHHWILPSPLSGMTHFKLKDGPITVVRFDGDCGKYELAVGEGQSIPGPFTQNNYVWIQVNNWPRWERQLMEGPFIHHVAMTYGRYGEVFPEAVKYISDLLLVKLG
jgi:L-fucose isomerase-like protein